MNTGNEQYRVSRSVSASLAGRALQMCKKCGSLSTTPARGSVYAAKDEWSLQTGNQYCKFNGKTSRKTSTRWMSLPAGIESSQHRTRNQLTKNRLRVKLLISLQPRHEQKAIKRKHLRKTRSHSVIQKMRSASQTFSIIMGRDSRLHAKCLAGIHIMGQSQKGLRRQQSSARSRWWDRNYT